MSKIGEQKSLEAYPQEYDNLLDTNVHRRIGYRQGYEQAMQDFLEKACEWISKNAQNYMPPSYSLLPPYDTHTMIYDLKNYMENESEN